VHRHRVPPSIGKKIDEMQKQEAIEMVTGRIESAQMEGKLIQKQYCDRRSHKIKSIEVGSIIQCTGPNYDLSTISNPLVQSLM
jgi:uncharacterized NAD(P)/FAD-binding protein YdhS